MWETTVVMRDMRERHIRQTWETHRDMWETYTRGTFPRGTFRKPRTTRNPAVCHTCSPTYMTDTYSHTWQTHVVIRVYARDTWETREKHIATCERHTLFQRGSFWKVQTTCNLSSYVWERYTNRIDYIVALFCRIASLLWGSFAKETYDLIDPTNIRYIVAGDMWERHIRYMWETHVKTHIRYTWKTHPDMWETFTRGTSRKLSRLHIIRLLTNISSDTHSHERYTWETHQVSDIHQM